MTRTPAAFRRLHMQIIAPLVAAAVAVGVIATIVAIGLLSTLTDQWVATQAEATGATVQAAVAEAAEDLESLARFATQDDALLNALSEGSAGRVDDAIERLDRATDAELVLVLDEQGVIMNGTGAAGSSFGGASDVEPSGIGDAVTPPHVTFARIGEVDTVLAVRPFEAGSGTYVLAVGYVLDDDFLISVTRGSTDAFAVYDDQERMVATTSRVTSTPLFTEVLEGPSAAVRRALEEAQAGYAEPIAVSTRAGKHSLVSTVVVLPGDIGAQERYLVALSSLEVTEQARTTTTRLITMWSAFAVLVLVGLGGWIARSVSTPLLVLSEGARRVADGDFSTRVRVSGPTEIRELGGSFNAMTESLRERTENLTKKVLELATLYEMSRSLGTSLDLEDLLDSVLESALRIFDVESGYVSLTDRESGLLTMRAVRGPRTDEQDERAVRSSMADWVVREGRPLIFNPPGDRSAAQVDAVTGASAALAVPLGTSEGVVGAITVATHDPVFRFGADDVRLLSTVANHVGMAIGNIELFVSLQGAYLATVKALAAAVDAKDAYTRGHSEGVAVYSLMIGRRLELSSDQMTALEMAAYLHDIGKIGVREEILLKPGRLTDGEMEQMRHHPLIGASILRPVAFPWPIAPVVRHHHEHCDGRGYPAGLQGEEIPLLARVLSVADAYEAMISDRPYRKGRTTAEAVEELRRCAGTQFDERIVDALIAALDDAVPHLATSASSVVEGVESDEARAVFVAICDGMLGAYKRLGGPRLASNLEALVNDEYAQAGLPYRVSGGHLSMTGSDDRDIAAELPLMRAALERLESAMEGPAGRGLVDHFYDEAFESLSDRMRGSAVVMDFRARA